MRFLLKILMTSSGLLMKFILETNQRILLVSTRRTSKTMFWNHSCKTLCFQLILIMSPVSSTVWTSTVICVKIGPRHVTVELNLSDNLTPVGHRSLAPGRCLVIQKLSLYSGYMCVVISYFLSFKQNCGVQYLLGKTSQSGLNCKTVNQ